MNPCDCLSDPSTTMWMHVLTLCALATAASDVASPSECSSECGLRPVSVGMETNPELKCALNASSSSADSASWTTMQCWGHCPLTNTLCRPLSTRIKKVQLAVVEHMQR